jgi:hypothetical protein
MAKILFAWELGAGLGHCVKAAPIAAGLIARGHSVYFAARNIVTARQVCGDLPIVYLPAPQLVGRTPGAVRQTFTFAHILHNAGFGDDAQLGALVANWRNLIELIKPAAVLCEHAPSALLASRCERVPRFVMGTGFSLPPKVSPWPDLRPVATATVDELVCHEMQLLERANRILDAAGAERLNSISQIYEDVEGRFLTTFAELDHHRGRSGDAYCGAWSLDGGERVEWPAGDGPRVFAYLKSGPGPWRVETALAALRSLNARTIAYVPNASPAMVALETPSFLVSSLPAAVSALRWECDLAVLHGTAGSTTQFLLAGVPVLLTPLFFEQAILSLRVSELGAGLVINPRGIDRIASFACKILQSGAFRQTAAAFSARHAQYNPLTEQQAIVDAIDSSLQRDR